MGTTLLWILHLAFSLLLLAAALAWGATRPPRARRLTVALALLPLLAFHVLLVWKVAYLRFDVGVLHAPWRSATALLVAHLLGSAVLLARARRTPGAAAWPTGTLALAALFALALDATTLWNLELAARLRLSDLRVEAGRIAWRESPPRPDDAENAAPAYLQAAKALETSHGAELDRWRRTVRDLGRLDTADPGLRVALEAVAPQLEAVRAATRLPACWFEPEPVLAGVEELVAMPRVTPLLGIADALALEARVRAADGDTTGALEDVHAILALSDHLAQTPVLIALLMAGAARDVGVMTLARVLGQEVDDPIALEGFELAAWPTLSAAAPRALAMEEAYGLSMVGLLARGDVGLFTNEWDASPAAWLDGALYAVFLLEQEVAGYRESARELQELARAPLAGLLAAPALDVEAIRGRGVLASLLVPNIRGAILALHRADARMELARLALAAARYRLEHDAYPTTLAELGADAPGVELEGDGSWVRLLRPDLEEDGQALDLRLPPQVGD